MTQHNWLPDFIDQVSRLQLLDPLGAFLTGTTDPAPVEYGFADVVKLSGHCCPTVAGAYAMTLEALERLYPDEQIPMRGEIAISCPGSPRQGALGPFSQVLSHLTGACAENGFQGLGGQFRRQGLLSFRNTGDAGDPFYFTRLDNDQTIGLIYDSSQLPADPLLAPLMGKALGGEASTEELAELGRRWQERVGYLLLSERHRKEMIIEVACPEGI